LAQTPIAEHGRHSHGGRDDDDQQFRTFVDTIPQLAWRAAADGSILWYNRRWYAYTGSTFEEMAGWGWQRVHHPDELSKVMERWKSSIATGLPFDMVFPLRGKDGIFRPFLTRVEPETDNAGNVVGWFGTNTDISEQRLTEVLLRESEERLQLALSAGGGIGTWDWDVANDRVVADERFARLYGVDPEKARKGAPVAEFFAAIHPDDLARVHERIGEAIRTSGPFNEEYRVIQQDGSVRWVVAEGRCERSTNGTPLRFPGASFDITERKMVQQQLVELNAQLERKVIERSRELGLTWQVSPYLLGALNSNGYFETSNPAWQVVLGWSEQEVASMSIFELLHPDDVERTRAGFELTQQGQPAIRFPNRYRRKDGSYRWISWVGVPEGGMVYCSGRDITDEVNQAEALKRAEQALRQAQKMEAVGQLTGGLAHDFNNLLAGISGSLEVIEKSIALGRTENIARFLATAKGGVTRAAAVTHRLLAFSRLQTLEPKPTNINRLVAGMEELIRHTVGPAIRVEVVGAGGLWSTLVDPNQLENALLNLCLNARDAMPDGGTLTVETANRWLDDGSAAERDLAPGQYVSLSVTDSGVVMDADTIAKAFDPFFTTKPLGAGTCLGLSMTYGFARQSGGQTRIYSEVGRGTTVNLYLPRHRAEAEVEMPAIPRADSDQSADGQVVLVIDDEPSVRMLVAEVLGQAGYGMIEASDGPSGLRALQAAPRIDLLVTDVGLPGGMNGRQVADAARSVRPGLKVLFITGYAENAVVGNGYLESGTAVLTKPFAMDSLARKIREMLAE